MGCGGWEGRMGFWGLDGLFGVRVGLLRLGGLDYGVGVGPLEEPSTRVK